MRAALAAAVLTLAPATALAHHSYTLFDTQQTLVRRGVVKAFLLTNPHCRLDVIAPDGHGHRVLWALEMGSPGLARRAGWSQTSVKPGDAITVSFHPRRDGAFGGLLDMVSLPDGRVVNGAIPIARFGRR
jgi:hypothetical protein